jgi:hypothetical protein
MFYWRVPMQAIKTLKSQPQYIPLGSPVPMQAINQKKSPKAQKPWGFSLYSTQNQT